MEITDIKVNPDNLHEYCFNNDSVKFYGAEFSARLLDPVGFDDCLEAHSTLNDYLQHTLGGKNCDWGGKYATFLGNVGINFQCDNGWWSEAAVTPENIQFYTDYMNWDCDEDDSFVNFENAMERWSRKKVNHGFILISDFIEAFE